LTLSASPSNSTYGQQVALTATLSPYSEQNQTTNGETVTFYNGANILGIATLTGGVATLNVTSLPVATDSLKAAYAGDTNFAASTSNTLSYSVANAATLTLSANPTISTYGQQVTLTATLSPYTLNGQSTNGESVTFSNGTTNLGTATLASGVATLSVTSLPGGTNSLTANYSGDSNFASAKSNVLPYVVNRATPSITWANPASVTYGAALSAAQLDATASVPGTFAYTPAVGAVPLAGADSLSVTFTPTDAVDFATATKSVSLVVNQATPTIAWANPSAITYGTALSGTQLNATASVPGTFAYTPAAGAVPLAGTDSLSVTFTPTDTTDYTTATASVSLLVNKATPAITWPSPPAITYGTALSAAQLNATASTAGTFTYTPVLGAVPSAGHQALSVSFSPTDTADYVTTSGTNTVTVNPASLTVTAANASRPYGAANPTFSASIAGAVNNDVFTTTATSAATSSNAVGTYAIVPTVAGPNLANYSVNSISGTLTVTPAVLTVVPANATRAYGATNPVPTGTVTGTLNGDTFTVTGTTTATATSPVGSYPITYTVAGSNLADYSVVSATGTLTITQARPVITWPTPGAIAYGTALSAAQLNATASTAGTFSYTPAAGTLPSAGAQTLSVTFTPTDTTDYGTATSTVSLTVNKATLAVSANNAARVFGAANPAFTGTLTGAVNGDTFTATFSTAATAASTVGSYPIIPSVTGANIANYNIMATNGALTISQAGTATTFALSNSNLTLTATVGSLTSGTPTGAVGFYEGQTLVGTGTLLNGVATYTTTSFPTGDVVVSAEYSGDVNFTQSSAPPIFVLSVSPATTSLTVAQAGSVTDALSIAVAPGYSGTVTFSCTGLPHNAACSFQPSSVAFTGTSTTANVTMTIQTSTTASVSAPALLPFENRRTIALAATLWMPGLFAAAVARRRRSSRLQKLLTLLLLCGLASALTACGSSPSSSSSSSSSQTPAGSSTVQVIASGPGGLAQTTSLTLTVQ
jgi:hypothetical protein